MDIFGLFILLFIIVVGWTILRPKKKSNWWKYGYNKDRDNPKYERWREKVRKASKGCIVCGSWSNLHCHHIIPFSVNRWKRYSVRNGVTLCEHHHMLYHDEYSLSECNGKTLRAFIKKYKK